MFEIASDIIQAHIEIETYWYYVLILDSTLIITMISLFYGIYPMFRKHLIIRDRNGREEFIGFLMQVRKCEKTPDDEPCKYRILFRRRSWLFWVDLIHLRRLYYNPPEGLEKPIERQIRRAYIVGKRMDWCEHPLTQYFNYYYIHQGQPTNGRYEDATDYIQQGDLYTAKTTRSVQLAIQSDSELASRCFHVDTVALQIPGLDVPEVFYHDGNKVK